MTKEFRPQTKTVEAIGLIPLTGNIIHPYWYKVIRFENGKADFLSINLLADLVYWYRPTEYRDETSGELIALCRKFYDDKLQRWYRQWAEKFGVTPRMVTDAMGRLKKMGLVTIELRTKMIKGVNVGNVPFPEPIPIAVLMACRGMLPPYTPERILNDPLYDRTCKGIFDLSFDPLPVETGNPFHVLTGNPSTLKRGYTNNTYTENTKEAGASGNQEIMEATDFAEAVAHLQPDHDIPMPPKFDLRTEEGREQAQAWSINNQIDRLRQEPWLSWLNSTRTVGKYNPPLAVDKSLVLYVCWMLNVERNVPINQDKPTELRFWLTSAEELCASADWNKALINKVFEYIDQKPDLPIKSPKSLQFVVSTLIRVAPTANPNETIEDLFEGGFMAVDIDGHIKQL